MGTRAVVVALGLSLAACNEAPVVEIGAPVTGTLIDHHDAIRFELQVIDEDVARLELALDGEVVPSALEVPLPPDGDCGGGCATTLVWSGVEADEGDHVLTVVAIDQHDERGEAALVMRFEDTPTMVLQRPTEPDQLGVGTLTVEATVVDRSQVVPTLSVDGVVRHEGTLSGDCRYGCTLTWPWDTDGLEGGHDLAIIATDPFGRTASVAQSVELGDIPYASAIEITGETDNIGFGSLEVEIHLFDADTGAFLGCSGEHSGLESVDESNQRYPVLAWFQDTSGVHVPMSSLAGRNVRVDVIEDDAYPCPQTADLGADDPVGSSPATPAESFATLQPMSFQNVVYLELSAGRPYER